MQTLYMYKLPLAWSSGANHALPARFAPLLFLSVLCALCVSRCSGCALWSQLTQQGQAQGLRIALCFEPTATAEGVVCTLNDQ